jgi:hypothetical protein
MDRNIVINPTNADGGLDKQLMFDTLNKEEFHKRMDTYNFSSKAQAARYFINIGMRSIVENDPRNAENSRSSQAERDNYSPKTIRDFVPEGEDNAVDIRDELVDRIEDEILNICREDPEINIDNWEAHK